MGAGGRLPNETAWAGFSKVQFIISLYFSQNHYKFTIIYDRPILLLVLVSACQFGTAWAGL